MKDLTKITKTDKSTFKADLSQLCYIIKWNTHSELVFTFNESDLDYKITNRELKRLSNRLESISKLSYDESTGYKDCILYVNLENVVSVEKIEDSVYSGYFYDFIFKGNKRISIDKNEYVEIEKEVISKKIKGF